MMLVAIVSARFWIAIRTSGGSVQACRSARGSGLLLPFDFGFIHVLPDQKRHSCGDKAFLQTSQCIYL